MLHGARTYVLQDEDGQTRESHSISAGLDYPGVGPQHAYLAETGRATYRPVTDAEAMDAFALLSRTEGIIPAIESAHAVAGALELAKEQPGSTILVNLSGRGDKDMGTAIDWFGLGETKPTTNRRARQDSRSCSSSCLRDGEGRGSSGAGRLPAGRLSRRAGGIDGLRTLVDAGCDVIEIGLPYSDPVMDGPTIQAAAQQALEAGTRTVDVIRTVEAVAATGVPTVVMTYWNPIERYGVDRFAKDLANAGGAGLITPDLDARRGSRLDRGRRRARPGQGLPGGAVVDRRTATHDHRACRGFVYATAVMGVTGARESPATLAGPLVGRTRAVSDLPVGVGLGVSNGDQAAEVAAFADGVIVGSALVRTLLDAGSDREAGLASLAELTRDLAEGVRRA